jgi:hypothetical protein
MLYIFELQIFNASNQNITPTSYSMSSIYSSNTAAKCFDGDLASTACCTTYGDTDPWLRASYACSGGSTPAGTKAVVTNWGNGNRVMLTVFTLDFVNAGGNVDGGSFRLGDWASYSLTSLPPPPPSPPPPPPSPPPLPPPSPPSPPPPSPPQPSPPPPPSPPLLPQCRIVIRLTDAQVSGFLTIMEVQIYNASNQEIRPTAYSTSSAVSANNAADK